MSDNSVYVDCKENISRCVMIKNPDKYKYGDMYNDENSIVARRANLLFDIGCGICQGYCKNCINFIKRKEYLYELMGQNPDYSKILSYSINCIFIIVYEYLTKLFSFDLNNLVVVFLIKRVISFPSLHHLIPCKTTNFSDTHSLMI